MRSEDAYIIVVGANFLESGGFAMEKACELADAHEFGEINPVHLGPHQEVFELPHEPDPDCPELKRAREAKDQLNLLARIGVARFEQRRGKRFANWVSYVQTASAPLKLADHARVLGADLVIVDMEDTVSRRLWRGPRKSRLMDELSCPVMFVPTAPRARDELGARRALWVDHP